MFPAPQPQMQQATQPGQSPLTRMGGAVQGQGGQTSPDPQQMFMMYGQKVEELEKNAESMMQLMAVIDPEGQALLVPIAQAGSALKARVKQMAERYQAGPGAPGGAQAAGGGSPAPNPDEGGAPAAMAA